MPINPNISGQPTSDDSQEHPLSKMPSFEEHIANRGRELAPDIGTLTECYAERVVYTDKDGEEHRFAMTPVFLVDNVLKSPDDMRVAGIALQHMASKWRNDDRNPSRKVYADGSESGWEDATRVDDGSDNLLSEWAKNHFSADKDDSDSTPTADPGTLLRKYGEREGDTIKNPFSVINSGQYLDDPDTMFRLGKELSHMAKRWHEDQSSESGQRVTEPEYQTNKSKQQVTEPERKVEKSESEPQSAEEVFDHVLDSLGSEKVEGTYISLSERLADIGKSVTSPRLKDLKRDFEDKFSNYQVGRTPEYVARSKDALQSVKDNYNNLAQRGLISQDVAKAWLQQDFIQEKPSLYSCYNDIQYINVSEENSANSQEKWDSQKAKYQNAAASLARKHPNAFWQSSNIPVNDSSYWTDYDFIHVNADKNAGETDLRCYITPNFAKDPSVVLDAWQGALEDTGLQDSIYFKVMGGLGEPNHQRLDSIVIYKNPNIPDNDFRNCLETFRQRCQQSDPEALPDDPLKLPAATQEIAPGITIAPEPKFLNEVLRTSAETRGGSHFERHSWTTFVDRMMLVSMSLAANRLRSNQQPTSRDAICSEAKKCFRELMLLSKINPDTMLPVEYDNARPSWTNLV